MHAIYVFRARVPARGFILQTPPRWADDRPCRPPSAAERRQNELALEVLRIFDAGPLQPMRSAAVDHFGLTYNQNRDAFSRSKAPPPCPPTDLIPQAGEAALHDGVYAGQLLSPGALALAEQLGPAAPGIVKSVAATAFRDIPIEDPPWGDIRPYARTVLAGFGSAARPWAAMAYGQISTKDALGGTAAQVSVGGGDPRALRRVRSLMANLLAATPANRPVPLTATERLYELAYALGMAGPGAQPYADPLIALLERNVETLAPPFGVIDVPPKEMCPVARHIGGRVAEAANRSAACRNWETRANG